MVDKETDVVRQFRDKPLLLVERLIGMCDRNDSSPSRGCFDRHYWCYKLHDCANARYQEGAQFLRLAQKHLHPDSHDFIDALLADSIDFWGRSRNSDGSVNEIYPYERSFCATSMSTAAIAGVWMDLEAPPEIDFRPTAEWLLANDSVEVANQMAGACLSLARIGIITGEQRYLEGAHRKVELIGQNREENGCFGEYGGPDVGYATISLSLLAGYHQLTQDELCLQLMKDCAGYLESVVEENGLYPWQTMSRRTQFLYPAGLAYLKSPVLQRLMVGLAENVVINPLWLDDRYCIPIGLDYLLAAEFFEAEG